MENLTKLAVEAALASGASYADARAVDRRSERARVKNGSVEALSDGRSQGVGVRVIADGAWGFAGCAERSEGAVRAAARRAVELARAAATTIDEPVRLADVEPVIGSHATEVAIDPADVPLDDRLALLMECDRLMRAEDVEVAVSFVSVLRSAQHFASSEGASIYQERVETGGGLEATAVGDCGACRRSYPSSHGGQVMTRGWELIDELEMTAHAGRTAAQSRQLVDAPECPPGPRDLILAGGQLALQLHESCGHPIELDRVLGTEASFAGTSFLTPDRLGSFRYGSDVVNITADATLPGGLGSFAWDDEGVPAQRSWIVRAGVFTGYLTSRETAAQLGLEGSNGSMRADGWARPPLIRMTNINLEPGDQSREEIIASTERGVLMEDNLSWSIDDRRLNFQFGCEIGWLIEDGEIAGMVRQPGYTGITPEFWRSCDAVADGATWRIWGVPNCGKGEPGQTARVGHGVSAARFRNVQVGVTDDE
ncbi:MAG: TldD/PmbA family protein [Armatimonadota bacterium]|jgi:TldD protein